MKIMITGAQGQLGRAIHQECLSRQIECAAFARSALDISDLAAVQVAVYGVFPNVIINCAAYNDVDRAENDFHDACLINGIGPKNLAIAAEELKISVMHFSTDFVFDGQKTEPYHIADTPKPVNRYGQSKLLGEQLLQSVTNNFFLVRLSWVFGDGDNFVKKVLHWISGGEELHVVDDQVSCPSYTVDLAPALLDLLDTGAYGLYHLSNGGVCSRYDWARHIVKTAGSDVRVLPVHSNEFPVLSARPSFSAMDSWPIPLLLGRKMPTWQDATERFLYQLSEGS